MIFMPRIAERDIAPTHAVVEFTDRSFNLLPKVNQNSERAPHTVRTAIYSFLFVVQHNSWKYSTFTERLVFLPIPTENPFLPN